MSHERMLLRALVLPAIALSIAACGSQTQPTALQSAVVQDPSAQVQEPAPADGNLAPVPVSQTTYNAPPAEAPQDQQAPQDQTDNNEPPVYAEQAPPPLPEYDQPPAPADDDIWTPGYWNYADAGYYWVPGAWIVAPYVDALWTPPYWEFYSGRYRLHHGYWGRYVGFYGGINYGHGYTGRGYYGGYWDQNRFRYNRAVTNVNVNIVHNVYERKVVNQTFNRVSYNGGPGGLNVRPIPAELAARRERSTPPVPAQVEHARNAQANRAQFASQNRGRPAIVAQSQALATPYRTPAARGPIEPSRPLAQNNPRPDELRPNQGRPVPEARPAPREVRPQGQQIQRPNSLPSEPRQPQAQRPEFQRQEPPRPAPQPQPQPQSRPESRREQPAIRQEPPRQERPAPQARPESAPRPAPGPQNQPREFSRPAPQPAPPPVQRAPEARPAPAPGPPPVARPAPAPPGPGPAQQRGRGEEREKR